MDRRIPSLVLGVVLAVSGAGVPAAQTTKPAARAIPRLADGHPDLQGIYDLATLTPVERQAGQPLILTDEQAKTLERQVADRNVKADAPIEADRSAPPKGGDGSP